MQSDINNAPGKIVDLDLVIKQRNSRVLRNLPRFIISYLKKIVHQNDINRILNDYKDCYGLEFISRILEEFNTQTKILGEENIPQTGRFVFASNHPLGGLDGLVLLQEISRISGETKTIANDLLMYLKNIESLFIGVNKHGMSSKESIRQFDTTFASDLQVLIFPAGLVSRRKKKKIRDLDWKKTFITKAIEHKRDIIPMHINGRISDFFYNLSNFRKFLCIKTNIEMLFLVHETFKQVNKKYILKFGKPISYKVFDKRNTPVEWAQLVKQHIYTIGEKDYNSDFRY